MNEKMPGNGKKTVARSLDDLGEALRQRGFNPEAAAESAAVSQAESPEEIISTPEASPDSKDAPEDIVNTEGTKEELPLESIRADILRRIEILPRDPSYVAYLKNKTIQAKTIGRLRYISKHEIAPFEIQERSKKMDTEVIGPDLLTEAERTETQTKLLEAMGGLEISAEKRIPLERGISGIRSKADARELINMLERFPAKNQRPLIEKNTAEGEPNPFSGVSKALNTLSEPARAEKSQTRGNTRLNLLHPDTFGTAQPEIAHPNAKGISFGSPKKEDPTPVKEALGVHTVKENGITRVATREEIDAFNKSKEYGPWKPPQPGPMTDRKREVMYELTGDAASKLINGLDGLAKKAAERVSSNVPKIKQKSAYVDESMVPPTVFKGKLSKGVRDPRGSHESIYHEKISNISEILQNPRRQVMFGEYLKAQGHDGLIEKYYEGQKNPSAFPISQNLILHRMLSGFDKRFAAVEQLKAGMTKGDAEAFMRENTELGFLQTGTDSDRAFEALRDSLDLMLMVMPENEYEGVVDTLLKNQAIRTDYRFKAINERTRKTLKDEGVSVEDLNWETIKNNPYLLNAIRRPKFLDWAFGDESSKNSQEMLDAIKFNRKIAGTLLAATLQNDPLFKQRLLAEIHTREKAPETAAQGIAAYEGVLTEQEKVAAMEAMKPEAWTEKIKDPAFKAAVLPNWDTSTEAERADAFSDHLQKSGGEIHIRRGWLAWIIAATFGAGVRKTVENLKAQGAFK